MTATSSPYDPLLTQMREVLDIVNSQSEYANEEALQVFDECARRIHVATVPDPLYQIQTRPPAIDEALEAARVAGSGFLLIQRGQDGKMTWTALPLDRVVFTQNPDASKEYRHE